MFSYRNVMTMTGKVEGAEEEEEEDLFEDTFQIESQVLHAVNNIEEKHCNNNETDVDEICDVGDDTLAAMCRETPQSMKPSKLELSNNKSISRKISLSNENPDSPKFASTPTSLTSQHHQNEFTTAKKLLETSSEFQQLSAPTNPSLDEKHHLSSWGLPECVVDSYHDRGIRTMFPWQVECLTVDSGSVLAGANLVYSAPTSAGKTLVAELLMMKRVFETQKKALLILPFVSLAREKMFHLQSVLRDAGVRVEGFMGSQSPAGGLKTTDIAVATIEKANSLVNRLLEEGKLDSLACVVVDELHMLGDQSRGYLLELLLTKILYTAGDKVQIIGMSATLPNLSDLSNWLKASLYTTTFRPVPLTELIKIDSTLLDTNLRPVGAVRPTISLPNDTDNISWMCLETLIDSHSVLVFCPIKSWVESLAETIAGDFYQVGRPDPGDTDPDRVEARTRLQAQLSGERLAEVLEQLARCPAGLDATLAKVIRMGVAYHHAGLTTDERDIVESGFKNGVIRVLVATSTLSSGVNLPARRVILRCPLTYNGQLMDKLQYKQMVGRAGRKGVDTEGESILICKKTERDKVSQLVRGESEPVISCLAGGQSSGKLASSMKRAILEVVVSGAASTVIDVERYASCTLLAAQLDTVSISDCVQFLLDAHFIKLQDSTYAATRLGLACLASSLAPDEGLAVYAELSKARRQFVLENELHIIYLIVPIYAAVSWPKLDWMGFLTMWEGLGEDMKRVGAIVGVEERWMVRAMRGTLRMTDPEQRKSLAIHQRFYTALALHDLVNEMPLHKVAAKFGATKGMLQSLQQAASTFSGMVTVFCDRLGWNNLELLVGQFQSRLEFGIQRELVGLCSLISVDGARARILYDAGLVNVATLASSKTSDVEQILHTNTAFTSNEEAQRRKQVKNIFISGLPPMTETECAALMVREARSVMARDLGLSEAAWSEAAQPPKPMVNTPLSSLEKKKSPSQRRSSLSSSKKPRRSTSHSPKLSPHLKYQLENNKPQNISQAIQRSLVSPDSGKSSNSEPNQSALIEKSPTFNQDKACNDNTQDMFDCTFDMSSVVESIFVTEAETTQDRVTTKKRVSWGDEKEGVLCVEKEITPQSSQVTQEPGETPSPDEVTYQPKTPKFKVCSEDLDLHWSGSDSGDSDCVIEEEVGDKDTAAEEVFCDEEELNESSDDVFGESISDSLLARAVDQPNVGKGKSIRELSVGMMEAFDGMDTLDNFSIDEAQITREPKRSRKRKKRLQLDKDLSSQQILSGSDSEEAETPTVEDIDTTQFTVVDVCSNRELFKTFSSEWKTRTKFSLAVGVSRSSETGCDSNEEQCLYTETGVVCGLAVSWAPLTSFYILLHNGEEEGQGSLDDSLHPPDLDTGVSLRERIGLITSVITSESVCITAVDWRRQALLLYHVTGEVMRGRASDPSVASWLLDPGGGQPTLARLVLDTAPDLASLLATLGTSPGYGSVASCPQSDRPARLRAVAEAALVSFVDTSLRSALGEQGLLGHYTGVEMECQHVILDMELSGMGLNEREYEDTKLLLEARLRIIEEVSYRLAGRHFSLSSPPDICKVLYHELRLPVNGDPKLSLKNVGGRGKASLRLSANKEILEKLIASGHKLPALVLEHRRLSSALTKTLSPLLHVASLHPVLKQPRVYPTAVTHTATGRVALQEPNLQNIPKDFQVELTADLKKKALGRRVSSRRRANSSSMALTPLARLLSPADPSTTVSLRLAITPLEGNLLLSADYSQLELRILAHLSGDETLIRTLSSGGDVFRSMAAEMNTCGPEAVTDKMRQQAKQIVYGVIYGIGDKSLADQLGEDIGEAAKFMEKFKSKYPKVRSFLHDCVVSARKVGVVETISGRKRRLEDIHQGNLARRSAAERQSVNTRVQGSAADLVKTAMVNIDKRIRSAWPQSRPLKWSPARAGGERWPEEARRGCHFVLQLHDELIYEVSGEDVVQAALIVKEGMEAAMELLVPTPVRVKVGANWGELQDFNITS